MIRVKCPMCRIEHEEDELTKAILNLKHNPKSPCSRILVPVKYDWYDTEICDHF